MANILLLEDDESLNRGISLKLQKEGYQVFSAFGVTEAKQIFGSQKIDLIISDITMKDGNGLEFAGWVRKTSDVHLLFLTALNQEVDIVNGYDVGADDYITKPFSLLVLISKVHALMRRIDQSSGGTAEKEQEICSGNIRVQRADESISRRRGVESQQKRASTSVLFSGAFWADYFQRADFGSSVGY